MHTKRAFSGSLHPNHGKGYTPIVDLTSRIGAGGRDDEERSNAEESGCA